MVWVVTGSVMAVAAVLLLRQGWDRDGRSWPLLGSAWGLLMLAVIAGAAGHGAWGVAMVSLFAMLCAFACLAVAGWTAPPDKARASSRRAHALPDAGEPLRLGRRLLTFLFTVPLALIVSLVMGLAARVLIVGSGGAEADGNVATLFLTPTLWGLLAFCLMMSVRRRTQLLMLAMPALAGGLCLFWSAAA